MNKFLLITILAFTTIDILCERVLKEIANDNNYGNLRLTAETVLSEHKKKDERHFFWRVLRR